MIWNQSHKNTLKKTNACAVYTWVDKYRRIACTIERERLTIEAAFAFVIYSRHLKVEVLLICALKCQNERKDGDHSS